MRFTLTMTAAIAAAIVGLAWGQNGADRAEVALHAAMKKESVDGDLKSAIEQYKKLAQNSNKSVASQALVRLGECYEKQGNAEARRTYEQVLSKFGDQKEAVEQARARLAAMGGGRPRVRRLADWDQNCTPPGTSTRNLCAKDDGWYEGGRRIAPRPAGVASWAASPDGATLLYTMQAGGGREAHVIDIASGKDQVLLRHTTGMVSWWVDNRHLLLALRTGASSAKPGADLLLVSVAGGQRQAVGSIDGDVRRAALSGDGKFVAFEWRSNAYALSNISILAVNGGDPVAAVPPGADCRLVGWHSDGRLVFVSDRRGTWDVMTVRIQGGRPADETERIYSNIGLEAWLGREGSIYFSPPQLPVALKTGVLDAATGTLTSIADFGGSRFQNALWSPAYSRDGRLMLYAAGTMGKVSFVLRDLSTGTERTYVTPFQSIENINRLLPDGSAVLVQGSTERGGPWQLFRFRFSDSQLTKLPLSGWAGPGLSTDGRQVYLRSDPGAETLPEVARLDMESGESRTVFRPADARVNSFDVSPDGERIVYCGTRKADEAGGDFVAVVPVAGGAPKMLLEYPQGESCGGSLSWGSIAWTADGTGILYQRLHQPGGNELWIMPAAGGAGRKLASIDGSIISLAVHPDGRQLAWYVAGAAPRPREISVIENALPASGPLGNRL